MSDHRCKYCNEIFTDGQDIKVYTGFLDCFGKGVEFCNEKCMVAWISQEYADYTPPFKLSLCLMGDTSDDIVRQLRKIADGIEKKIFVSMCGDVKWSMVYPGCDDE